jgi:hypothetical protein
VIFAAQSGRAARTAAIMERREDVDAMSERQNDDQQEPQKAPPARAADPQKPGEPIRPGPQEESGTGTEVSGGSPATGAGRGGASPAGPDDR